MRGKRGKLMRGAKDSFRTRQNKSARLSRPCGSRRFLRPSTFCNAWHSIYWLPMRAPSSSSPNCRHYTPQRSELAQAGRIRRKAFRSGGEQTRHARRKSPRPLFVWCFPYVGKSISPALIVKCFFFWGIGHCMYYPLGHSMSYPLPHFVNS